MKIGNKSIKEVVKKDIFRLWDTVSIERARDELKKMYLKYYNSLTDIEEKRLILHNLCVAEMQSKDYSIESAKKYTEILLNDMDIIEGYTEDENNACDYVKVLNNYIETHKECINKDELIKLYKKCNYLCENFCGDSEYFYLMKLIARFNLYLIQENFNMALESHFAILIHNNGNSQYIKAIEQNLKDMKKINVDLYNKALELESSIKKEEII